MRRRHAISAGFSGHYRDLGIGRRKRLDSAYEYNLIRSVVYQQPKRCRTTHVSAEGQLLVDSRLTILHGAAA